MVISIIRGECKGEVSTPFPLSKDAATARARESFIFIGCMYPFTSASPNSSARGMELRLSILVALMKLAHIPAAKKSTRSRTATGSLVAVDRSVFRVRRDEVSSSSLRCPTHARLVDDLWGKDGDRAPSTAIFLRFVRKSFFFCRDQVDVLRLLRGDVTRRSALTITGGH